jgi:hypothetical protein
VIVKKVFPFQNTVWAKGDLPLESPANFQTIPSGAAAKQAHYLRTHVAH